MSEAIILGDNILEFAGLIGGLVLLYYVARYVITGTEKKVRQLLNNRYSK